MGLYGCTTRTPPSKAAVSLTRSTLTTLPASPPIPRSPRPASSRSSASAVRFVYLTSRERRRTSNPRSGQRLYSDPITTAVARVSAFSEATQPSVQPIASVAARISPTSATRTSSMPLEYAGGAAAVTDGGELFNSMFNAMVYLAADATAATPRRNDLAQRA
ncbi:hypothetical protein EJB05_31907, partial [Eragrostis curvula]